MRERNPEVPLAKRPEPSHVTNMNGLIEAEVDADLLNGLLRHVGVHEPQRGVARGEVHHEEDDRGDAKDEGNGAEEPPHNECCHGPISTKAVEGVQWAALRMPRPQPRGTRAIAWVGATTP